MDFSAKILNEHGLYVNPLEPKCPVCCGQTEIMDAVDFNLNGITPRIKSGIYVTYNICSDCDFLFAPEMCKWSPEQFAQHVYNDHYVIIDPGYINERPAVDAEIITRRFEKHKEKIRHLDYGGGEGRLTEILRAKGFDSTSYDPFVDKEINLNDLGKFNLITAFEVFEHVPNIQHLTQTINSLRTPDGLIYFSTDVTDGHIERGERLTWWYISPRAGHICLYSKKSLLTLAKQNNMRIGHLNHCRHLMWNASNIPEWAKGTIL